MKPLLVALSLVFMTGCGDAALQSKVREQDKKISELSNKIDTLEWGVAFPDSRPAIIETTDNKTQLAKDNHGLSYNVCIHGTDYFSGGVSYKIWVTNIYSVTLTNVELKESGKSYFIPEIKPGFHGVVSITKLTENYPKYLSLEVSAGGTRFS